ncbi:MAG: hypothetical protein GF417_13470, partial [Candidatus Latescibacteria bacterium]|nr:hypothetical protein [bacterium]MBD3425438.1 hypothetical protein [Candidatus Latescibacterota bacterium]
MSRTPEEKKRKKAAGPAGGSSSKPSRGQYKNSLTVLRTLVTNQNLDRALGETAEYIVRLMNLRMFAVITLDRRDKTLKLLRAESEKGQFHYVRGLDYHIGSTSLVDDWIEELSSSEITEYSSEDLQDFLIKLTDQDLISEDILGAVVHKLVMQGWSRVFFVNGGSRDDITTFCAFVYSRKVPRTHPSLMRELTEHVGIGVNMRVSRDRLREKLIKYETIVESQARSFFLLRKGRIEFFSRHLPAMLGMKASRVK